MNQSVLPSTGKPLDFYKSRGFVDLAGVGLFSSYCSYWRIASSADTGQGTRSADLLSESCGLFSAL